MDLHVHSLIYLHGVVLRYRDNLTSFAFIIVSLISVAWGCATFFPNLLLPISGVISFAEASLKCWINWAPCMKHNYQYIE